MQANDRYFVNTAVLRDSRLSWKAKGIFSLMAGYGKGEIVSATEMINLTGSGRDQTLSGLHELADIGYIERRTLREKGRIVRQGYSIVEKWA